MSASPPPPSPLFETVKSVFAEEGWAWAEVEGRQVVRAGFEAHHSRVELHLQVFPELAAVSVVAESALAAGDPARRERLAELVMRVNQRLTVGNFEMDWDAGRVLFRATNLFSTEAGDPKILRGLVHTTVFEMDRIAPPISIICRAQGPELAGLDIPELIGRTDLLPPEPGER